MTERGAPIWEQAYALGKMLDHSAWQRDLPTLPRFITPSDIDATISRRGDVDAIAADFDNAGRQILIEFSRTSEDWRELSRGQRLVYEGLLRTGPHIAVLCHHDVAPELGRKICSRRDVTSVQVMLYDYGLIFTDVVRGNEHWQRLVRSWFNDPLRLRRYLIGYSIGMRRVPANVVNLNVARVPKALK
jgi:hypothetical protein